MQATGQGKKLSPSSQHLVKSSHCKSITLLWHSWRLLAAWEVRNTAVGGQLYNKQKMDKHRKENRKLNRKLGAAEPTELVNEWAKNRYLWRVV